MATDPLQRIRDLLALAGDGDGSSEEARNAAVAAARLLKEHGYIVQAPGATPAPTVQVSPPPPPSPYHTAWTIIFRTFDPTGRGDPKPFLDAIYWTMADLDRVALRNRNVSDEKIKRFHDLCIHFRLQWPIPPEHPMRKRLGQLLAERQRKEHDRLMAAQQAQNEWETRQRDERRNEVEATTTPPNPLMRGATIVNVNVVAPRRRAGGTSYATLGKVVGSAVDFLFAAGSATKGLKP